MKKWLLALLLSLIAISSNAVNPPPSEEVFKLSVNQVDPNTFTLIWQIKPGYFLYRDRIGLTETQHSNFNLGVPRFPASVSKIDKQGNHYQVYRHQLILPISILGKEPGESLIDLHYQGCADDGFCYPPAQRQLRVTIDKELALAGINFEDPHAINMTSDKTTSNNNIEQVFANPNWLMIMLSFFGFGLLLSFTPCVLPMIPVLSGIIVGHSSSLTTRKAFLLSLSYVLSMSLTYAMVGAIVALLGSNLQIAMQTPVAITLFSLLFVLLALSMFGFFELKIPLSWQTKLASVSRNQASGHYVGAAIMGCLSSLILSPCVTAPLIGALSYIAHSGNVALGSLALFFSGLGMGTPLLLIGTSAGKWLPKAGPWMNKVKAFFGILLLGVALFLLQRIMPDIVIMMLWAALLVLSGIYLGALSPAPSLGDKFSQGTGILLLVYGLLVLVGASMGESNPLQPLASLHWQTHNATSQYAAAVKPSVKTLAETEQAIHQALGKPVMLDFYADWCTSCKIMEATTFKDPAVQAALKNFTVVKVDITGNNEAHKALLQKFNVIAPPTFLFFNAQGQELSNHRLVGEMSAAVFLKQIHKITLALNDEQAAETPAKAVPAPFIIGIKTPKSLDNHSQPTV